MTTQRIRLHASDIQRSGIKALAGDYEPATEYMRVVAELDALKGDVMSQLRISAQLATENTAHLARIAELVETVRDLENKLRRSLDECRALTEAA